MCRNIKPLFNFDPPATDEEIRNAALQFVRKVSGFQRPSQRHVQAFDQAVDEIADAAERLLVTVTASLSATPAAAGGRSR
jgi:hypothetical protein